MKIHFFVTLFYLIVGFCNAQSNIIQKSPIATTRLVADKMIRTTPFEYQLIQNKPSTDFNNIKFLNFSRTFGDGKPAVAYALSVINAPVDTTITLQISHSDGCKMWVNKRVVYEKNVTGKANVMYRERTIDLENECMIALKKGNNEILIKSVTNGEEWNFYIRPKKNVKDLKLSVEYLQNVHSDVSKLSNWLVIGSFPNPLVNGERTGLQQMYEPETEFENSKLYQYEDVSIAWTIPKIELNVAGMGSQLAWGDHNYSWNYHAGGVAWAMAHLAAYTNKAQYDTYSINYCNFFVERKPFLAFQKYQLGLLGNGDAKLLESNMLDFTSAPSIPFTYHLQHKKDFTNQNEYERFFLEIKDYIVNKQVRLPEGNFTRATPRQYTTWTDDMYMGIPFLVHASLLSDDLTERKNLMEDAVNQVFAFNKQVWDAEFNLYRQTQYSDKKVKIPFWSRANGWGLWAVSEVLLYLPKNHPKYNLLLKHYKIHVDALISYQNSQTGFWHNLIDKPDSYPETSGTAIFTMAMARGINSGWLDRKKYMPFVMKGWNAIDTMIEADGTLHGTCIGMNMSENIQDYYTRPVADDDTHGVLPVLFAGIEVDKMVKKKSAKQ